MEVTHVFAGIPTADYAAAVSWYERLLGRAPDGFPKQDEAVWHLAATGSIHVVADAQRAGNALVVMLVDELEGLAERLRQRGIRVPPLDTVPGVVRRVTLADPDGNTVSLGEPLSSEATGRDQYPSARRPEA